MGTRLYRSRRDRMLAGVAGGLAEMWGADPTLVRLIWALLVIFTGGIALVVYIVMAVVIPEEEEVYPGGVPTRKLNAGVTTAGASRGSGITPAVLVGGFLVVLGGFFLIREFLPQIDFDWFWPLILVVIGVVLIVAAMGRRPNPEAAAPPPPPPRTPPPTTAAEDAPAPTQPVDDTSAPTSERSPRTDEPPPAP